MMPAHSVGLGKARPSPPPPLKVNLVKSSLSRCQSQSVIDSRKTRYPSLTTMRGKKTRHQGALSARTVQGGLASSPTEGLNHGRAIVCVDRHRSSPGDHSPKASNTKGTKTSSKTTSEDCLGHESQMSASMSASETAVQTRSDKHPSTSRLVAIVQSAKKRRLENLPAGQPHASTTWSWTSAGQDTTWPSWSSDNGYKEGKDKKRNVSSQPPASRRIMNIKANANISTKRPCKSPTREPSPVKKSSKCRNGPEKKHVSSDKKNNSFKSLNSTSAQKVDNTHVFSHSVSPLKTARKPAVSPQSKKKEFILLGEMNSWDSLSPRCSGRLNLSSSPEKKAAPRSSLKQMDIYETGRSGPTDMTKVPAATVASACRPRLAAKRFQNNPCSKRKLSFSPSVVENVNATKYRPDKGCSSRSLRNNYLDGDRKTAYTHSLKINKANRSDRSTDSGFQESVSKATLDWFSAYGLISAKRSGSRHKTDSAANVDTGFELPTNFSNGSPLTAMYSIEEQRHSSKRHSPVPSQSVYSIDDAHLQLSAIQTTDELSVQTIQLNKSRSQLTGEPYKDSLRFTQTSEMIGNSDQTFEQISESALAFETVEYESRSSHAGNDSSLEQLDVQSLVAETYAVSDTCGLVSDIVDNNSDVTDVSADWDFGPSCQESSCEPLRLSKKERSSRRDTLQLKDPTKYKKCSQRQGSPISGQERLPDAGVPTSELEASPETSMREESFMQELSFSNSFIARGFNSNTRRTVEISYDLIAMTNATLGDNTPTFSDRPGLKHKRRSLSEPPRGFSATQSRQHGGESTSRGLPVNGGAEFLDLAAARSNSTARSRLPLLARNLNHFYWSNVARALNQKVAAVWHAEIPEPKLFYIGCFFILGMSMFLSYILTFSIL